MSPHLHRSVTVVAPDAAGADAFSTAFSLLPTDAIETMVAARPGLQVRLFGHDGLRLTIG
jgi:thiamine biosynthesis lipoprotein